MLAPLGPEMIVLDAACGAGHLAEQAAPHVRQVVGVDLTRPLLDLGATRLRDRGVTNALLQEGDVTSLAFVDESFDVVACRAALHHVTDPAVALREMARVCRPGGRVVVSDLVPPTADVRADYDDLHRAIDPSHAGVLLEAELAQLLEQLVGPLAYGETTTIDIPLDVMCTDLTDRDRVVARLRADLDGGHPTGFLPTEDGGALTVSLLTTTVQATRAAPPADG